ncbi:NAD(P)H-flavin reductase [Glaciecola sp. 1036]|uniref:NAD(P)H-flavin reductase n=1 Tax=Alteromonadaceae TaxID=72275 RepID=UPI003D03A07D
MKFTHAEVLEVATLTAFVKKVVLKPTTAVSFKAGQYLQVVMGEKDKRPFSIASAPDDSNNIELHIGATPENAYAYDVLTKAIETKTLDIEVGLGDAYLRENTHPLIIVAGGTGYSYAKSILYHVISAQPERPVTLYWGAKQLADLYEFEALEALSKLNPHFIFVPVVETPEQDWAGKTGLVHEAVLDDIDDLSSHEVYTAGRFEMAATIRDTFIPKGLDKERLFGDAYAFI